MSLLRLRKSMSSLWGLYDQDQSRQDSASTKPLRISYDSSQKSMSTALNSIDTHVEAEEPSKERSPQTFLKRWSNTIRSAAAMLHYEEDEADYSLAGSATPPVSTTPKKQSQRSPLRSSTWSRSFTRSRRLRRELFFHNPNEDTPEKSDSPASISREPAPVLNVDIPGLSFAASMERVTMGRSQSPEAALKSQKAARLLWPGPTVIPAGEKPTFKDVEDPYIESLTDSFGNLRQPPQDHLATSNPPYEDAKRFYFSDDKGYLSEVESNAERHAGEDSSPAVTASPNSMNPSTDDRYSNDRAHRVRFSSLHAIHHESKLGKERDASVTVPDLSANNSEIPRNSEWPPIPRTSSLKKGLNLLPAKNHGLLHPSPKLDVKRISSEAYEADAETSETSPKPSKASAFWDQWDRSRAERNRRYAALMANEPSTESDLESQNELELKRTNAHEHVYESSEPAASVPNLGAAQPQNKTFDGELHYAVEAIEKTDGVQIEKSIESQSQANAVDGHLRYAVEAIERKDGVDFDLAEPYQEPHYTIWPTDDESEEEPNGFLPLPHSNIRLENAQSQSSRSRQKGGSSSEWTDGSNRTLCPPLPETHVDDAYAAALKAAGIVKRPNTPNPFDGYLKNAGDFTLDNKGCHVPPPYKIVDTIPNLQPEVIDTEARDVRLATERWAIEDNEAVVDICHNLQGNPSTSIIIPSGSSPDDEKAPAYESGIYPNVSERELLGSSAMLEADYETEEAAVPNTGITDPVYTKDQGTPKEDRAEEEKDNDLATELGAMHVDEADYDSVIEPALTFFAPKFAGLEDPESPIYRTPIQEMCQGATKSQKRVSSINVAEVTERQDALGSRCPSNPTSDTKSAENTPTKTSKSKKGSNFTPKSRKRLGLAKEAEIKHQRSLMRLTCNLMRDPEEGNRTDGIEDAVNTKSTDVHNIETKSFETQSLD